MQSLQIHAASQAICEKALENCRKLDVCEPAGEREDLPVNGPDSLADEPDQEARFDQNRR